MALASGVTRSRSSSANSAPRSMTSSAASLASSFQSSKVSRASLYLRRSSFRICFPGFGANNSPIRVPAPNPISRKVIAVPAELLSDDSYFPSRIKTPSLLKEHHSICRLFIIDGGLPPTRLEHAAKLEEPFVVTRVSCTCSDGHRAECGLSHHTDGDVVGEIALQLRIKHFARFVSGNSKDLAAHKRRKSENFTQVSSLKQVELISVKLVDAVSAKPVWSSQEIEGQAGEPLIEIRTPLRVKEQRGRLGDGLKVFDAAIQSGKRAGTGGIAVKEPQIGICTVTLARNNRVIGVVGAELQAGVIGSSANRGKIWSAQTKPRTEEPYFIASP